MDHITALEIFTRKVRARVVLVAGGLALLTACRPTEPSSCPDDVLPAFAITVRAADGPLPADILIRLAYGGGMEEFALEAPAPDDERVMFCDPLGSAAAAAAGAGGEAATGTMEALLCKVWIEGAATLWVTGGNYPELVEELEGEANECGPETVEEELVLGATHTDSSGE
jgi:hypothetical protein